MQINKYLTQMKAFNDSAGTKFDLEPEERPLADLNWCRIKAPPG